MRLFPFITIFLWAIFQWPTMVQATGAGFVPDGQIWFSNETPIIGEPTQIYTVIINNDYYSLDATVGFFVDGGLVDTAVINNFQKEQAIQIRTSWRPTEGEHTIAVEFINASATDESGNTIGLDVKKFNAISTRSPASISSIALRVEKHDNELALVQLSPQTNIASGIATGSPFQELDKTWQASMAQYTKTKEAVNSATNFVSNAIEKTKATYTGVKSIFERGDDAVTAIKSNQFLSATNTQYDSAQIVASLKNKNSKLLAIIIASIALLFLVVRVFFKKRDNRRW